MITITKKSVSKVQQKLYSITLNLTCTGDIVIDRDFSEYYRTGDDIDIIVSKFKTKMQKVIDDYKEEQVIFTSSQFDSAVSTLQSNLME